MQKVKLIIVEDEFLVASDLKHQLLALEYEVCAIAKSGSEALRYCEMHQPDLVLMDIKIKGELDGIDTAAKIAETYAIPIIYLSDQKDKATLERAKKTPSHSFLSKPVDPFNLNTSIEFAIENHRSRVSAEINKEDGLKDFVFIREGNSLKKVLAEDILWVKAGGAYCEIKTTTSQTVQSKNMREACKSLDSGIFIKIHKSYTINATKIDKIEGNMVTIENTDIPIGKTYLQAFKKRLNII